MNLSVKCPVEDCDGELTLEGVDITSDYSVGLYGNVEWDTLEATCAHSDYDALTSNEQQKFIDTIAYEYANADAEPSGLDIWERHYDG